MIRSKAKHIVPDKWAARPVSWLVVLWLAVLWAVSVLPSYAEEDPPWRHAFAMHGEPKYGPDYPHFDYANPDAPVGGLLRNNAISGFDSFNAYSTKGDVAPGIGSLFDSLMVASDDEAFTRYAHVAEAIRVSEDRSWVEFRIDPDAYFHDGHRIDAEDVVFTYEKLVKEGPPAYAQYYGDVASARALSERVVRFDFKHNENRELPLILSELPVLPRHVLEGKDFSAVTLEVPIGSGPYRVENFEVNRSITYYRDPGYWAWGKPAVRGHNNFGRIRYNVFRDATVLFEAFKGGAYDIRSENVAKNWAQGYDFKGFQEGYVKREPVKTLVPKRMQAMIFNLRLPKFQDIRVREALTNAFDFEWLNKTLFFDSYQRLYSFFQDSELAATGVPSGRELEILEPFRSRLPDEVFGQPFTLPKTDASGVSRAGLRKAVALLDEAGFKLDPTTKKRLTPTGEPFTVEFILAQPDLERIILPFGRNLDRLGIETSLRVLDSSQYAERVYQGDFDMVVLGWSQSLSPGNEQRYFWGSAAADQPYTANYMGLKDPVVDELIELVIRAPDREELLMRTRALDRVLQWKRFIIPQYYNPFSNLAWWDRFDFVRAETKSGLNVATWWFDEERARRTDAFLGTSTFGEEDSKTTP